MNSKIPLPTDNIFKFYALFGLMLIIASAAGVLYLNRSTNELLFDAVVRLEELSASPPLSSVEAKKKEVLEMTSSQLTEQSKLEIPDFKVSKPKLTRGQVAQ